MLAALPEGLRALPLPDDPRRTGQPSMAGAARAITRVLRAISCNTTNEFNHFKMLPSA
jgi:hypothetical protein